MDVTDYLLWNLESLWQWSVTDYHTPFKTSGSYVRIGHPVLMNWLDLYSHFRQGRHCETSSVELHPDELEVLTWCEVGLLEVDDPSEKLEDLDGCLGMQLSFFWCICPDQPVV